MTRSQHVVDDEARLPFVSVVVACRNESRYVRRCLAATASQTYPRDRFELILVDGMSDDDSLDVANEVLNASGLRHTTVSNPDRTAPAAFNLGLRQARGEIVIIASAHCELAPDYVTNSVRVLSETDADVAGGALSNVAETPTAQGIALALHSPIGVGDVAFRTRSGHQGPVDTVPFGAYRRDIFERVGEFDEAFVRNQDDELNFRITQSGGRIWMDPAIKSRYYARSTMLALWRQYFGYGLYKILILRKHRALPSWRHWVPALFVSGLIGSVFVAMGIKSPLPAGLVVVPYLAVILVAGASAAHSRLVLWPIVVAAFLTVHTAYGLGFLWGVWRWRRYRRSKATPSVLRAKGDEDEPRGPRRRLRRWIVAIAILLVPVLWVTFAGAFLVATDRAAPAEAVFIPSGGPLGGTVRDGVPIFKETDAPRLVIFVARADEVYDARDDLTRYLEAQGVPRKQIRLITPMHSTAEEAGQAAALIRRCEWRRVTMVTSPQFTRRAGWIYRRAIGGSADLTVRRTKEPWRGWLWWTRGREIEWVVQEWIKVVLYARYLFVRPPLIDSGTSC